MARATEVNVLTDVGVRSNNQTYARYTNSQNQSTSIPVFKNSQDYGNSTLYDPFRDWKDAQQNQIDGMMMNGITMSDDEKIAMLLSGVESYEYVVDGATLECDGCPGDEVKLMVTSQSTTSVHKKLIGTKKEIIPIINIPLFKKCEKSASTDCMPIIIGEEWLNYNAYKMIEGKEPLIKKSCALCKEGGIITVKDSGQSSGSSEAAEIAEELKNIAKNASSKEAAKKQMSEYLSSKYGRPVQVEDFNYKPGAAADTLDLVVKGKNQAVLMNSSENYLNHLESGDYGNIDLLNDNGVFISERKDVNIVYKDKPNYLTDTITSDFPIQGTRYGDSQQYHGIKNLTPEQIGNTVNNWNVNERIAESDFKEIQNIKDIYNKENEANIKHIIYDYYGTQKETIVDMTNYQSLPGLGLKPEKVYTENGQMIVEVNDYSNFLNRQEYQNKLEQYRRNGVIIKATPISDKFSDLTSAQMYNALGKEKYSKIYTDVANAEAKSYLVGLAEMVAMGYVMSKLPATSTSGKTGAKNSEAAACFIAGTLVYGKENKRIEELKAGDYVYSYNEVTKRIEAKKVLKMFKHEVSEVLEIYLENGEVITTTKEHPFYVGEECVEAGDLLAGMFLVGKDLEGIRIEDMKVRAEEEVIKVYNIEVEGNHNYFVGESFVLVHNKSGIIIESDRSAWNLHGEEIPTVADFFPGSDDKLFVNGVDTRGMKGQTQKFYSVINENGGEVHVSTIPIKRSDFADIVDSSSRKVNVLSGVHGDFNGFLDKDVRLYNEDIAKWGNNPRINIIDVSELSIKELGVYTKSPDVTVCGWCNSERSQAVLESLDLIK